MFIVHWPFHRMAALSSSEITFLGNTEENSLFLLLVSSL